MLARIFEDGKVLHSTEGAEILAAIKAGKLTWVELERQTTEADELLLALELHPLTIEDIWHSRSRPKIDDFPATCT